LYVAVLADQIQMLIVDSVAFHFRHGFEEISQRFRTLDTIASLMHRLVVDFNLSVFCDWDWQILETAAELASCLSQVLLINQVTARSGNTNRSGTVDVPTLGKQVIATT
jgi:hypothetical protein